MSLTDEWAQTLVSASAAEFWMWAGAGAALSAAAFVFTFRWLARARLIEDLPTSRIRSAAQGYVELEGVGELMKGEPILAPLTGTPCTWYRCRVEERVHTGRRQRWRMVNKYLSDELFLLRDATGICVVDPEGADVIPGEKLVWYGTTASPTRTPLHTGRWSWLLANGDYRYTEERMLPGDPLYALGWFNTVGGASEAFDTSTEVRELLASWKRDAATMKAFDRNGDGEIDMAEWTEARHVATHEVRMRQHKRAVQPGIHTLSKPKGGQHFLLSARSQARLTRRFRWLSAAALVTFIGGGGAVVWAVAVRLGTL